MACVSTGLIIGGGIAGLSAALALARVGVRCEVVEISDAPQGASLALSGRAAEALEELGVYDECCDTGRPFTRDTRAGSLSDAEGHLISAGPQRPDWPGAKAPVAVYRPVFLQVLGDAAEGLGVEIRRGVTARFIDDLDGASSVTFTDGETRRYDFVVGADGLRSLTRDLRFPDAPKPTYAGQLSIRWMVPGPAIEEEGWYLSSAGRLGLYYLPRQSMVYVPAVISMPKWRRLTDDELLSLFTGLLDSYTAPAVAELRQRLTPESQLIGRPFEWVLVPQPWHHGRTLLIGDAAHATTAHMGMGGGMALEDAVVLAQSLAGASTLSEAFDAFMVRRFARVQTVVETSVKLSRLEQEHAPESENVALLTSAFETLAQPY